VQGGKVVKRIIRSRLGHEIVFDDSDGQPSVVITTNGGHKVTLSDARAEPKLEVETHGKHKIVLNDSPGQESIEIVDKNGGNSIQIDSVTNSIALRAVANLRLEAGGQLILVGAAGIALSAPTGGSFEADGPLTIKSVSAVNLESGGVMTIKGAKVEIN
jgi:hypothetical protein